MAELPASWGLKTQPTGDGRLNVVERGADGQDHHIMTTQAAEVQESEIAALSTTDREKTTAREFVRNMMDSIERDKAAKESSTMDEWVESLIPAAKAGLGVKSFGYSRRYAANFERVFGA